MSVPDLANGEVTTVALPTGLPELQIEDVVGNADLEGYIGLGEPHSW